jgi:hypothetical protein
MGKYTISMAIFNSYVSLPEGNDLILGSGWKWGPSKSLFRNKSWSTSGFAVYFQTKPRVFKLGTAMMARMGQIENQTVPNWPRDSSIYIYMCGEDLLGLFRSYVHMSTRALNYDLGQGSLGYGLTFWPSFTCVCRLLLGWKDCPNKSKKH